MSKPWDLPPRLTILSIERLNGQRIAKCRCACGALVEVRADRVNTRVKSCGCLQRDRMRILGRETHHAPKLRHGMFKTPEYQAWADMRSRCSNVNNKRWRDYGGRGISVCRRWELFENFYADMGARPGAGYSIDRINNNGNYEPGNCRWATDLQQRMNSRSVRIIEFNGKQQLLSEWAKELGVDASTLHYRIAKWGLVRALTTPALARGLRVRLKDGSVVPWSKPQ